MSPEPANVEISNKNGANTPSSSSSSSSLGMFTWQEVSQHNTPDDAFISIRGKVYDVTDFLNTHPGGKNVLLMAAGRDATLVFESYHPIAIAQLLGKFEIGTLTSNELPVFAPPSPFFITLKARVAKYFKDTKQDPKSNGIIWMRYSAVLLALLVAYYFQFFSPVVASNTYLQIVAAVFLGFFVAQVGEHSLHDGSHFCITHSPLVWKIMVSTHDFILGASSLAWMHQHTFGHHPYTNIDHADPDVNTRDPHDFRRIKPFQKWFSHYTKQYIFAPFLYGLLAAKIRIKDFHIVFVAKAKVGIRINPISTTDLLIFFGGKFFFFSYRIFIPLLLTQYSLGKIILFLCVADLTTSYWLALLFQVSHIAKEVKWPLPDEKNFIQMDWAEMQILTTQDYAHESTFWAFITGGLNYQAIHHLFPQVHQYYYPEIGGIVKDTCKEFGLTFLYKESLFEALSSHLGHLKNLGENPADKKD